MQKTYFTVCLDCTGKPCLMIGGGDEAFEKSVRFWEARAKFRVVSLDFSPDFLAWLKKEKIPHARRAWKPADVKGKFFAINTVKSDPALSRKVWDSCRRENCLLSAYDQPDLSNITMPALLRAGRVRLAISSNGAVPMLARSLRQNFQAGLFGQEFLDFSEWLAGLRADLVKRGVPPQERRRYFRELMKDFRLKGTFSYPRSFSSRPGRRPGRKEHWPGPEE